jgi:hypothetical protein
MVPVVAALEMWEIIACQGHRDGRDHLSVTLVLQWCYGSVTVV